MKYLYKTFFDMIFDGAAKVITGASAVSIDIFSQSAVQNVLAFFKVLGSIIVAIGILFGIANYSIQRVEGDCIPFDELIMNIMKSIIACAFIQDGSIFIFNLANVVTSSIKDTINIKVDATTIVKALIGVLTGYSILWSISLGILFIFLWLFILLQAAKRGGMYFMQVIIGYAYLFAMPLGNNEGILDWCRQTCALAITNVLQISALIIALNLMMQSQLFPSIVILFAATSAEKIAGRFGMSAGGKQTIGSIGRGISTVGRTVTQVSKLGKALA